MKRKLLFTLLIAVLIPTLGGITAQQINGDFDDTWVENKPWTSAYTSGVDLSSESIQPSGWCVSNVAGCKLGSWWGTTIVASQTDGYNNTSYAVKLVNTANSFKEAQIVPAYVTLGTTWSTATITAANQDGGTFGGMTFGYKPDALEFYYQRSHGSDTSSDTYNAEEKAAVVAYLWKGTYKQANVPGNIAATPTTCTMTDRDRNILEIKTSQGGDITSEGTRIAYINETIEGDASDWTLYHKDFTYDTKDETPEKINVIISANDYFGTGQIGLDNTIIVDNVRLIYYHALSSLSYDGEALNINPDETIELSETAFDARKLSYTIKGVGATATVTSNDAGEVTITVYGNDYNEASNPDSFTTYKLQFKKREVETTTYTNLLYVDADELSSGTSSEENAPITLKAYTDVSPTNYCFLLEDFSFGGASIGDIYVENLSREELANGVYKYTGSADMTEKIGLSCTANVVAVVKEDCMVATIEVPVELLGGTVHVEYGKQVDITAGNAVETTATAEGVKSIVCVAREFETGWYTLCVPFASTAKDWGADVVREFTGATTNALTFTKLDADAQMTANTPYLVHFTDAPTSPMYFVVDEVAASTPTAVTYGDFTFTGNYEASKDMEGLYGVASVTNESDDEVQKILKGVAGNTLMSTGAFFSYGGSDAVQQFAISFDGQATGISTVGTDTLTLGGDIYTVQGVKVGKGSTNGLPRGLYIVGGKKVIVK